MILTPEKLVWVKAPFSKERGAFSLAATALQRNVKDLDRKYADASVLIMRDEVWRRVENTKSWRVRGEGDTTVDVSDMIDTFNKGRVTAPIIVEYARGKYWLVAGEQQLQVCRVAGFNPKVVFIRF